MVTVAYIFAAIGLGWCLNWLFSALEKGRNWEVTPAALMTGLNAILIFYLLFWKLP